MKSVVLFIVVIIIAVSCNNNSLIPLNNMKVIVWDMACADELINEKQARDSIHKNLPQERYKLYEQIFAAHKISREQFYKNYQYYQTHIEQYKTLLDSVQAYGTRERNKPVKTILTTPVSAVN